MIATSQVFSLSLKWRKLPRLREPSARVGFYGLHASSQCFFAHFYCLSSLILLLTMPNLILWLLSIGHYSKCCEGHPHSSESLYGLAFKMWCPCGCNVVPPFASHTDFFLGSNSQQPFAGTEFNNTFSAINYRKTKYSNTLCHYPSTISSLLQRIVMVMAYF